jgi:ubiquinone/menaquinone biosynthesis C-methylase UbiE
MTKNIDYWERVLKSPTSSYEELFECERKYLVEHITAGLNVLDIGCGEGRNMRTILEKTQEVVGVDSDEKAVEDAQKYFLNIPTVKVLNANAAKLPFDDQVFDVVTFLMILPNLDKSKDVVMNEIARVLKNSGKVILSTFSDDAFDERMKIYKQVGVPISRIEGTKFIFDESLGANISEQFSKTQIEELAHRAGLKMLDIQKVDSIAYICMLEKEFKV